MSQISDVIELFKKRRKFYRSIDVRIAAINVEDSWHNIRTRVLLSCDKPTDIIERKIDVGNFMVVRENIDAKMFPNLLETISRGEFEVNGVRINFFSEENLSLKLENWYSRNTERAKERWGIEWPLDVFQWKGTQKHSNEMRHILENVSLRLNCHDPPYENVYRGVRELLGLHENAFWESDVGRDSICYLLLPHYLVIEKCRLQGDRFDFEVKFHSSINHNDIRLSLVTSGKTTEKRQENFRRSKIKKHGAFKSIKKHILLKDAADVHLYPFLMGRENEGPSERRYVQNLKTTINSRFIAHEMFDINAEKLKEWLHGLGSQKAADFEHALTILFHTCGFTTEWLGRKGAGRDAPDFLAFCSAPNALIVGECKTDVFGWKEMRKLKDRAMRLCRKLKIDTHPVMFTCIEQNDIEMSIRDKARNESIKILSIKEIDELLRMALRGSKPRDVVNKYFQYGLRYPPQ